LGTGTYTLQVQERDQAGNWSGDGSFVIEVDKAGPMVTVSKPTPFGRVTSVNPVVSGSANDDHALKKVEYRINTGTYTPVTLVGGNWSFTDTYDAGANTVWVRGEDQFGNRDSTSLAIYKYPNVVFVRKNATGSGKSWEDAFGEMYQALDTTKNYPAGTEIWVTKGKYNGDPAQPQKELYVVRSNQKVIGGFFNDKPSIDISQRDLALGASTIVSTLSIGSYSFNPSGVSDVLIDGFTFKDELNQEWGLSSGTHNKNITIRNVKIDGMDEEDTPFYIDGDYTNLESCEFTNNLSYGTIVVYLKGGSTKMTNCRFVNNKTISGGHSPIGFEDLNVEGGYFEKNEGDLGMYHLSIDSDTQQLFINNAQIQGGQNAIRRESPTTGVLSYGSGNKAF
jgi:hypothetical protein